MIMRTKIPKLKKLVICLRKKKWKENMIFAIRLLENFSYYSLQ